MTPVLDAPIVEDIALDESILDDDVPCQYQHVAPSVCSVAVTHRAIACNGAANVCTDAANHIKYRMTISGLVCRPCQRRPSECWRVVPI